MARPIYQIDTSVHEVHQLRYRRRLRLTVTVFLLISIVSGGVIHSLSKIKHNSGSSAVGATYVHRVGVPTIYHSNYFQFSDSAQWVYDSGYSTPNKVIYLLHQGGVVAHSLTVYINQVPIPDNLATARVLPVSINNNSLTNAGSISAPCGTFYGPNELKRIHSISISGTTMECVPDSPQFSVVVGQVGGDYNLKLKRRSGVMANYIIIYNDLEFTPDPSPFLRIIQSFQAV